MKRILVDPITGEKFSAVSAYRRISIIITLTIMFSLASIMIRWYMWYRPLSLYVFIFSVHQSLETPILGLMEILVMPIVCAILLCHIISQIRYGKKIVPTIGMSALLMVAILMLGSMSGVYATPSPAIQSGNEPGANGPCTWFVSLDGTTPVARAMVGGLSVNAGLNVVGTAGQDVGVFLNSIIGINQVFCFSGQTFTISSAVTFADATHKATIWGQGNSTVFSGTGAVGQNFVVSGQSGMVFQNFNTVNIIWRVGTDAAGSVAVSRNVNHIYFKNIEMDNPQSGAWMSLGASSDGLSNYIYFENCYLHNGGTFGDGIQSGGSLNRVSNVFFFHNQFVSAFDTTLTLTNGWDLEGNTFLGPQLGGTAIPLIEISDANTRVIGNFFNVSVVGGSAQSILIHNNARNVVIEGNQITGGQDGIVINPEVTTNPQPSYITISHNKIFDVSRAGINDLGGLGNVIDGNQIFDDRTPKVQQYGYVQNLVPSTTTNSTLSNNVFFGNTVSNVVLSGTTRTMLIYGNQGYPPPAPTSITAGASVWTYTNNDNRNEYMQLQAVNGASAWTCNGTGSYTLVIGISCFLAPTQVMTVTWATTAPTFWKEQLN